MKRYDVWIQKIKDAVYPDFPYDPPKGYPELLGLDYMMQYNSNNEIYTAVREILYQMGFDRENYGTAMWNPLRGVVGEGNTVLIKPKEPIGQSLKVKVVCVSLTQLKSSPV